MPANARDMRLDLVTGSGRSPGRGHDNSLHYYYLQNPIDWAGCRLQSIGSHRVRQDWRDLAYICKRQENYRLISLMNAAAKILNKNKQIKLSNLLFTMFNWDLSLGQERFNIQESIMWNTTFNSVKDENDTSILTDAENIQQNVTAFHNKNLQHIVYRRYITECNKDHIQ